MLEQKEWTHFIGVSGSGMSGLAKILLQLGYQVSGSDLQSSDTTQKLQALGAKIYQGHHADYLEPGVQRVVISSAIPADNPELDKAKKGQLPILLRAELLAELMLRQKAIAIAGSHGKTTTTSMIAWCLEKNNWDPTVVIGGELNNTGENAKLGQGDYLVAEADESDGSFLKLHPYIAVVTNIEDDHLDHYGSVDKIIEAFSSFLDKVPENGFKVLCNDDQEVRLLAAKNRNVYTYGLKGDADYLAQNIELKADLSRADIYYHGRLLGELRLGVPGRHNVYNALATIAVAHQLGLGFEGITDALSIFLGAKRRFQLIGREKGIKIIDDYAHHPTEIKATLEAAKQLQPKRLWVVFQPHRFSRTKQLHREFGSAFGVADQIIVNQIYAAGEKPIPGVSAKLIAEAIENHGRPVTYLENQEDIVQFLAENCREGDLVITLGAGNIWSVSQQLLKKLRD